MKNKSKALLALATVIGLTGISASPAEAHGYDRYGRHDHHRPAYKARPWKTHYTPPYIIQQRRVIYTQPMVVHPNQVFWSDYGPVYMTQPQYQVRFVIR